MKDSSNGLPAALDNETSGAPDPRAAVIDLLQTKKVLDAAASARLRRAMAASQESSTNLVQQLGLAKEKDVVEAISVVARVPIANEEDVRRAPASAFDFNVNFLRAAKILPLWRTENNVALAMADPFDDASASAISYHLDTTVERYAAPLSVIENALLTLTPEPSLPVVDAHVGAKPSQADLEALQDLASDAPVIKFVAATFERASSMGASDVHFEPTEDSLRIRFRIDGALHDLEPAPFAIRSAVISRLKVLARLDIAETRLPQDGRAKIAVRGADIDLRVSTAPTLYGESVVVRLLDRSSVNLDLASLGFSNADQDAIKTMLGSPNGLLLVTGPTGSGKTTTLYAALRLLNDPRRKIFSVEDPVEYRISGVNQVQVNPKIGLTFATALRSLLRQDPDVMMVGEIRDSETAEIAIQAALTGHLVLATLHTNTAAAAVTRLIDMGVEDYLIGASVIGVIAQRLVGVLCKHCAQPIEAPASVMLRYGLDAKPGEQAMRPVGCEKCRGAGFTGRTTIAEVLRITPAIETAILNRESSAAIERLGVEAGMTLMAQDGLMKARRGLTSVEEVLRAVRA